MLLPEDAPPGTRRVLRLKRILRGRTPQVRFQSPHQAALLA